MRTWTKKVILGIAAGISILALGNITAWAAALNADGSGEAARGVKDERESWSCEDYGISNVPVWKLPKGETFVFAPDKNPGIPHTLNLSISYINYGDGQWNWDSLNGNEPNLDYTGYSAIELGKHYSLLDIWNQCVACARQNSWFDPSTGIDKIEDVTFVLNLESQGISYDPIYVRLTENQGQQSGSWKQDAVGWWYQNIDGSYPTSWAQINGNWYLFGGDGYMKTGWQQSEGQWYYMDGSGAMLHDTVTPDGYYVGSDGARQQRGE